jgi:hypothetical protein
MGVKVLMCFVTLFSVKLQFGRCAVRKHFHASLDILLANKELFKSFVEKRIDLDQAEEVSLSCYLCGQIWGIADVLFNAVLSEV